MWTTIYSILFLANKSEKRNFELEQPILDLMSTRINIV